MLESWLSFIHVPFSCRFAPMTEFEHDDPEDEHNSNEHDDDEHDDDDEAVSLMMD
jgi:hypothetical protein